MIVYVNRSITMSKKQNDNEDVSSFDHVTTIEKIYQNSIINFKESKRQ